MHNNCCHTYSVSTPLYCIGGGITLYLSTNYILEQGRSATAGCLFAYRPCNSPAGGVRATATSSGHRVRRCGHSGLTCRRTPAHNALCGTLTPQVIFTKPESFAVAMLPPVLGGLYVIGRHQALAEGRQGKPVK